MNNLLQDLRLALRQLSRSLGFVFTAVLILALGIAANMIVFGVLQGLILRPLDVPNPERVKQLGRTNLNYPEFSFPEVRDIRDNNTVFSAVGGCVIWALGLETNGISRPVFGYEVSGQYFEVARVKPFLGRLLDRADDDHPGASDAAVLSCPAWKSYFGADPNIVGKKVRLNKHPYTIVGVTPEGFYGTEKFLQPDVFVPMANEASLEGVDWIEQRDALGVLGLAGIVLLAACVNLGGLFAVRTVDRTREIAIRMSIGSNRWRILRQLLVKAFLIAILGGICACGLSWFALTGLANWNPPGQFPLKLLVLPQPSLIATALLVSLLAAALFGLMPLRQVFKTDPNEALKSIGARPRPEADGPFEICC